MFFSAMVSTRSSASIANDAHANNVDANNDANANADDANDANANDAVAADKAEVDPFPVLSHARSAAGTLKNSGFSSENLFKNLG